MKQISISQYECSSYKDRNDVEEVILLSLKEWEKAKKNKNSSGFHGLVVATLARR